MILTTRELPGRGRPRIGEEKKEQISVQMIDGKKCLVIPVEKEERILVNRERYD